jgi:hypothetical protein
VEQEREGGAEDEVQGARASGANGEADLGEDVARSTTYSFHPDWQTGREAPRSGFRFGLPDSAFRYSRHCPTDCPELTQTRTTPAPSPPRGVGHVPATRGGHGEPVHARVPHLRFERTRVFSASASFARAVAIRPKSLPLPRGAGSARAACARPLR